MNLDKIISVYKWCVVGIGTTISTLLGGWDMALAVLVGFVISDYLAGITAAWYEKTLDSKIGFLGIARKVFLFVPVGLAFWLDQLIGQNILRNLAIFFYLSNEGLSILENLGRIGVDIPPGLAEALQQLRERK